MTEHPAEPTESDREKAREIRIAFENFILTAAELEAFALAALAAVRAETVEQCAKVCDDEAVVRRERSINPLPGDDAIRPFVQRDVQASKAITATHLAVTIRSLKTGDNNV